MRFFPRITVLAALALSSAAAEAETAPATTRLITLPTQPYFTTSNAKERLQGSILFLIVETRGAQSIEPQNVEFAYFKGQTVVRTDQLLAPLLEKIDFTQISPDRYYPPAQAAAVQWPHAYRIFLSLPADLDADSITAKLTYIAAGRILSSTATLPIQTYQQKTDLAFPFLGPGIISVGGALASGHRNRSGLYAIDALGLNSTYGPMVAAEGDDNPRNYAGWGREILAPAAGTVVVANNDHVDQPVTEKSDPAYFLPQYKNGGDPGNLVVIDHGNGEFSMIAHMQRGSVRVVVGDKVAQGEVIGLMGNSGDTSGPHVHYQLQNGPDWERADALPFKFKNVGSLSPGAYFTAK